MSPTGAIFLDRDGTLNVGAAPGEYIRRPDELTLLPGAAAAVRRINQAGVLAVLVTNQRWLSRPPADSPADSAAAYRAVDDRLHEQLAERGAHLDGCYVCPHALDSCDCRKPAPGMLIRAAAELGISLPGSCLIGDSVSDLEAGRAAGTATVFIQPVIHPPVPQARESAAEPLEGGRPPTPPGAPPALADFVVADIGAAVDIALAVLQR
jgi:D-glycero-D-manno-heptose 1,7-bisphosphate phosphatase